MQPPFRRSPAPSVVGRSYRVQGGDTWSSLAQKHYGDALLAAALAECNNAKPDTKPAVSTSIVLPDPDELNRRVNIIKPENNPYARVQALHVLPTRVDEPEENSVVQDARARLIRARTGMGLHAKGGGWRPISYNEEDNKLKKKKKKRLPDPQLEDRWLKSIARLQPRSAMKISAKCDVGAGPALSLVGGLREARDEQERMSLVQRFLQAYGTPGHESVKLLLRVAAFKASCAEEA